MRLCGFLHDGAAGVGRVGDDGVVPLDVPDMAALIGGAAPVPAGPAIGWDDLVLTAPLRPVKLLAVAKNYAMHRAELSEPVPPHPAIFTKLVSAVTGPAGPVVRPAFTDELDYEGELAVVVGRTARNVDAADALDHVFGYTIIDDVSARDLQRTEPQWTRAKGCDTFAPLGPWVVTADEIPDPQDLRVRTWVNGELRQDGSTGDMLHSVAALIAWCSRSFTLQPGDVIATGTPAGVGRGFDPPRYLVPGDRVRIEIERIGVMEHPVA